MGRNLVTVKLARETRDALSTLGAHKETYDSIVTRLITAFKEHGGHHRKFD